MDTQNYEHSPQKIKVLVVDDHPLFRAGLERALGLEDDIVVVGHSTDGEQVFSLVGKLAPDVVILDVNLPGINGHQVTRQLRSAQHKVAVVMLTAYHDIQQTLYAMRAGASAYCAKNIHPDDLVNVIRDTVAGHYVINGKRMDKVAVEEWIQKNMESIAPYTEDLDKHLIPLSPRETEILKYVTKGMSNKQIATELNISQQTVKNHMTAILRKLNVEDRTQAAVTAIRHGWVRIQDKN